MASPILGWASCQYYVEPIQSIDLRSFTYPHKNLTWRQPANPLIGSRLRAMVSITPVKRGCSRVEFWLHAKTLMRISRVWGLDSAAPSAHIPEIDYVINSTLEPHVLLLRQVQEHPTPAYGDSLSILNGWEWPEHSHRRPRKGGK